MCGPEWGGGRGKGEFQWEETHVKAFWKIEFGVLKEPEGDRGGWKQRVRKGESSRAESGGLGVNTPQSEHAQLQMTKALGPLKDAGTFVPPFLLFFLSPSFPPRHLK